MLNSWPSGSSYQTTLWSKHRFGTQQEVSAIAASRQGTTGKPSVPYSSSTSRSGTPLIIWTIGCNNYETIQMSKSKSAWWRTSATYMSLGKWARKRSKSTLCVNRSSTWANAPPFPIQTSSRALKHLSRRCTSCSKSKSKSDWKNLSNWTKSITRVITRVEVRTGVAILCDSMQNSR